jgi:hypothetical protein
MFEAVPPLPQYAFVTWCSVKAQGQIYFYILPSTSAEYFEGKCKVVPVLFLIEHHAMKAYWEVKV